MVVGKLDSHMQKNESRSLSFSIHKNRLKMDQRLEVRSKIIKLLEENIGSTLFDIRLKRIFLNTMHTQTRETKEKINN